MYVLIWSVKWKSHNKALVEASHDDGCRFPGLKKCNVAMPTDAKTNEVRLENDALCLFMSAGNVEYHAFHGSKRIMQRCNTIGQKIGD